MLLAGVLLGFAPAATADDAPDEPATASLELEAARDCATRDALIARVSSRSQRIQFVAGSMTALRVTLSPTSHGVNGELAITRANGKRFVRRIIARTCREVVDALALIIAITLDPAHVQPEVELPGTEPVAPSDAGASTPPTPPEVPPAVAIKPPTEPPAAAEAPESSPAREPHGLLAAGIGGRVTSGPTPSIMLGIAAHVLAAWERRSIWSPAARLSFAHFAGGGVTRSDGIARFALDVASLDVCTLRGAIARLELRACATLLAGRLASEGSYTYSPRSASRPFAAAGGSLLTAIMLASRVELGARVAAAAPFARDAFQFTPEVFYRVASVTLELELGLAVRFP